MRWSFWQGRYLHVRPTNTTAAVAAYTGSAGQATSTVPTLFPRREEGVGHVPFPSPAPGEAEVIEECWGACGCGHVSYPCAGLACLGCSRVPRHVRGQPRLRDTWPEPLQGQGRLPAVPKPGCGRNGGSFVFSVKDGGRGPWEERFGSFASKKRATAPAIHHSHCLCCCLLARWASPRLWFFHMRLG